MKTPDPTKAEPNALDTRKFTGTDNPRHLRVIPALLARPRRREDVDAIAGCSNSPELIAELRRRGLDVPCERIEFILEESNDRAIGLSEVIEDLAGYAEEITKGPGKGMAFHVWSLAMVDQDVRATIGQFRHVVLVKIAQSQKNGIYDKTDD